MEFFRNQEESDARLAENLNKAIDNLSDKQTLKRFLWIILVVNILIWLSVIIFPRAVRDGFEMVNGVSDKIAKITLAVPFGIGFYITYAIFRLRFPDIEEKNVETGPMAAFEYNAKSLKRWRVWFFSAVGGVLNVLLLIIADIFFEHRCIKLVILPLAK